ncbi:hypothetical protein ACHAQA_006489 [Verticillium albo-atrum]
MHQVRLINIPGIIPDIIPDCASQVLLQGNPFADLSRILGLTIHVAPRRPQYDALPVASGLASSMTLETVLLRLGRDSLPWGVAARTAAGMSLISMLTMEAASNAVDFHLTGGQVRFEDPAFWAAAVVAMGAGFLAPLPYNYLRLRKYGKACH